MKANKVLSILIATSLVLLTGCFDYNEYENLALVSAIGIDTDNTNSQVTVTVEYLEPSSGSSSSKAATSSVVVKATGLAIADALTKIQEATGKKIFYGYLDEFVIGENAAKKMMKDILGYANRAPTIRTSAYLVITKETAEKVLSTINPNVTHPTGQNIHNLIEQSLNSGSAFPVRLQDFVEKMAISGQEPVAPMISIESAASPSTSSSTSTDASSDTYEKMTDRGSIKLGELKKGYENIDGIAAFQNSELVGWLAGRECTGLGWITGHKITPYEIVKTSSESNAQNTLIFRIENSKCNVKVNYDNGRPVANINASVEAELRKYSSNLNPELMAPATVSLLEKKLADNVGIDINAALKKGQKELKTDIFGIGFDFYRQYPALWHSRYEKKWKDIFPTLQINVNVTAKLTNTGTSIKKFSLK